VASCEYKLLFLTAALLNSGYLLLKILAYCLSLFDEYVNHRVCIRGKQAWVGAPTMSTIRCALRSLHILLPQIYRESMCAGLKVHLNGRDSGSTQPYKHKIHSYIQLHFLICSLLNLQCCLMQGCEHLQ
jgi:hypothetical protein